MSEKQSAWTRHNLVKQLALVLSAETRRMSAQAVQELLLGLAEEALSGRAWVVCVEAAEWPPPQSLPRELDGRSVCTRPGTALYATAAQLSAEVRLVAHAHAQAQRAPRLPGRAGGAASGRRRRVAGGAVARARAGRVRTSLSFVSTGHFEGSRGGHLPSR